MSGFASAAAGAGTMASFSDSETSSDNSVEAGTLDLTLDGASQEVTFLEEGGIVPGDQGQSSVTLGNAGTVTGTPEIEVTRARSTENGYHGDEEQQDGSLNDGELDEHLEVRASFGDEPIMPRTTANNVNTGASYTLPSSLPGGESKQFTVEWWLPEDTSNLAQSDGFEFDVAFRLEQGGGN